LSSECYYSADKNGNVDWKHGKFVFHGKKKIAFACGDNAPKIANALERLRWQEEDDKLYYRFEGQAKELAQKCIDDNGYPEEALYFLTKCFVGFITSDYSDSLRIARADDPQQVLEYRAAVTCCGSADLSQTFFLKDGSTVVMMFGYNYGH
jgi:hypothetical protein